MFCDDKEFERRMNETALIAEHYFGWTDLKWRTGGGGPEQRYPAGWWGHNPDRPNTQPYADSYCGLKLEDDRTALALLRRMESEYQLTVNMYKGRYVVKAENVKYEWVHSADELWKAVKEVALKAATWKKVE